MKVQYFVPAVLVSLCVANQFTHSQSSSAREPLLVSPVKGTVPFTVTLTVPAQYRERVDQNCSELNLIRFSGVAFTVDWGDGRTFPDRSSEDASCGLTHTYTVPGNYSV